MSIFCRSSEFISRLKSCATGYFSCRRPTQEQRSQDVSEYYLIIQKLIGEIERKYLNSYCVYRNDGTPESVRKLCKALLKNPSKPQMKDHYSVTISSAIKQLLKQVQLIPTDIATELHNIVKLHWHIDGKSSSINDQLLTALRTSIHSMPYENLRVLKLLIMHLKKFTLYQNLRVYGMTAKRLGVVLGPCFTDENEHMTVDAQSLAIRWNAIIEMLIENSDVIFGKTYMVSTQQLQREAASYPIPRHQRKQFYKVISKHPNKRSLYKSCLKRQETEGRKLGKRAKRDRYQQNQDVHVRPYSGRSPYSYSRRTTSSYPGSNLSTSLINAWTSKSDYEGCRPGP